MTAEDPAAMRILIAPEPTSEELAALLVSLRSAIDETAPVHPPRSRWEEAARQEQLRRPLAVNMNGWN